jgi:hypothetical protein
MNDFHFSMKNVKSPEDALKFKACLFLIYPLRKALLYYAGIEEKLEKQLALLELQKDSKFLEDYVIHQELPTGDFMKISFVAISQETFS